MTQRDRREGRHWPVRGLVVPWLFLLSLVACAPQRPHEVDRAGAREAAAREQRDRVAVRIDGEAMGVGAIERRIEALAPFAQLRLDAPERRREFLAASAYVELMADKAERTGLARDPDVVQAIDETLAAAARRRAVARPNPEALAARLAQRPEDYQQPARYRLIVLPLDDREALEEMRRRLLAIEDEQARRSQFGQSIQAFALDPELRGKVGDLGFVSADRPGAEPRDLEIARGLEPGQFSEIYRTGRGWQLALLLERAPARPLSLEEAAEALREDLQAEALEKELQRLHQKADVIIFAEAARRARRPAAGNEPTDVLVAPKGVSGQDGAR